VRPKTRLPCLPLPLIIRQLSNLKKWNRRTYD